MNKEKKLKEISESKISILAVLDRYELEGKTYEKVSWIELNKPFSLGSMKSPNKNIKMIKIEVPRDKPKDGNPFSAFFNQ